MRRSAHRLLPLALLLATLLPAPASATDEAQLAAIERTANDYLEGGTNGDIDRLRRAFHPSCVLKFTRDGAYQEWPVADYLARMRPGKRSNRTN